MAHRLENQVGFSSKDSGCGLNQGERETFQIISGESRHFRETDFPRPYKGALESVSLA